jgi:uncharacterized protein (DUF58 family)
LVTALEHAAFGGDETLDAASFETQLQPVARRAQRGSAVVFFSDLVDLPSGADAMYAALSNRARMAVAVRVLDPVEARFPFDGSLRLRSSFGATVVETDALSARAGYLDALGQQLEHWREQLIGHGGRVVDCTTDEPPLDVVRRILLALEGR